MLKINSRNDFHQYVRQLEGFVLTAKQACLQRAYSGIPLKTLDGILRPPGEAFE